MEEKLYFKFNETLEEKDYIAFVKTALKLRVYSVLFGVLILVFIALIAAGTDVHSVLFPLIFCIVFFIALFFIPVTAGKKVYRDAKALGDETLTSEIAFCEDAIYTTDATGFKKLQYDKIRKVVVKENHYFLMFTKTTGIILKKEAMTYGEGDFITFINGRKG